MNEFNNRHKVIEDGYTRRLAAWLSECEDIAKKIQARNYPPELTNILIDKAIRPYYYYLQDEENTQQKATPRQIAWIERNIGKVRDYIISKYGHIDIEDLTKEQASDIISHGKEQ